MVHMYADDMTIYVHGKLIHDVQLAFNYESSILVDWFDQNKLVVNIQKSFSMLLCTYQRRQHLPQQCINIHLCDTPVTCVKSLRLLGLTVDHNLSWQPHISAMVKRLQSAVGLLYRLGLFLDKKSMLLYYNSYVLPIFDNCMNIWGNAADVHIKK